MSDGDGLVFCETCSGTGVVMEMKCYGGPPIEVEEPCPDCEGLGVILVRLTEDKPELPKRVRDW